MLRHFQTLALATLFVVVFIFAPTVASAHQPRLVNATETKVIEPIVSKAYYGQLAGVPQVFDISSKQPFDLYVNILLPDIAGQKKDVTAVVTKIGSSEPVAILGGADGGWKRFWESYGRNWYWQGAEYKAHVEAGDYQVRISSVNNDSKYSLAIGEIESFGFGEGYNAMRLVPQIKRGFFNESPAGFIMSVFGWSYILIIFIVSFIFGFTYRSIIKRFAKNFNRKISHNIGKSDRWVRASLAVVLFVWAIMTTWSPWLFFFAGFCLFEAIFSWCGLYAALGKNTCPL